MKREPEEEAGRWFKQARDEFQDADELRQRKRFYLALFHFQQAAEKALKAFLYKAVASEEVFFTHSIYELVRMAEEADKAFADIRNSSRLDEYYVPTRYPNGLPGGVPSEFYDDPQEAEEAMILAKQVVDLVKDRLG